MKPWRAKNSIFWFTVAGLGLATFGALVAVTVITVKLPSPRVWSSAGFPAPAATPSPTPTPLDTTGWKTYRNEQHKFEIRVPQDWVIETTPLEQWTYFTSPQLKAKRDENEKNCNSPDPLKRRGCLLSMNSAWDLVFRIDNREISQAMKKRGINNREWYRQESTDWETVVEFSLLYKDNAVYNFFAPSRNEELLKHILSTFKFTK